MLAALVAVAGGCQWFPVSYEPPNKWKTEPLPLRDGELYSATLFSMTIPQAIEAINAGPDADVPDAVVVVDRVEGAHTPGEPIVFSAANQA